MLQEGVRKERRAEGDKEMSGVNVGAPLSLRAAAACLSVFPNVYIYTHNLIYTHIHKQIRTPNNRHTYTYLVQQRHPS